MVIEETITFKGNGSDISAYIAKPEKGKRHAALIIIQEIWGVDDHIKDVARRYANEGYLAIAPDLYSMDKELKEGMRPQNIMEGMKFMRTAPPEVQRDPQKLGAELSKLTPEQQRGIGVLMKVMNRDTREAFAAVLVDLVAYLKTRNDVDKESMGSLGFCMGGGLSVRLATLSPDIKACVIFYGEAPPKEAIPNIRAMTLGLYGEEDKRITDTVLELDEEMRRNGKSFDYHIYPNAKHAFFNNTRPETYNRDAAEDAWKRTLDFFNSCFNTG
ncbi:MAG: dienelactone hydrolase family protein [Candidatus Marsarchaeota archaeon]|nr:dienelactone hydrolase family protein [Candidatus Marsarchaeota archaeon]